MSPKLPRVTARELLRALQRDGWQMDRQAGSHIRLWHPAKQGLVTIAFHSSTLKPKTLATILRQAGLTVDDLRRLL